MLRGWFPGETTLKAKAIPTLYLPLELHTRTLDDPQNAFSWANNTRTLDDPRNAFSWAYNTRTPGLLKSIPLIQSISPRDLDVYHLYRRSISSITSHTIKYFSQTKT